MKVQKQKVVIILDYWREYPVLLIPFVVLIKTVKIPKLIFLLQKIIKYYCLIISFPVENGNSKQEDIGSIN